MKEILLVVILFVLIQAVIYGVCYMLAAFFTWVTPVPTDYTFTVAVGLFVIYHVANAGSKDG